MSHRSILLTGAGGFIGQRLASALTASGHRVRGLSRRTGHDFAQLTEPDRWRPLLAGIDTVINAVGIIAEARAQHFEPIHHLAPAALFQTATECGVERIIQISALGADDQAITDYQRSKYAADQVLRGLSVIGFILRPSLIIGADNASLRLFRRMARLPLIFLPGRSEQWVQPIHIDDVVDTVLRCLDFPGPGETLDLVGPQPLRFRDFLARLQCGSPPRYLSIPLPLLRAGLQLGQHWSPLLQPDNLRMLEQGSTADAAPLAGFLGRPLRGMETA